MKTTMETTSANHIVHPTHPFNLRHDKTVPSATRPRAFCKAWLKSHAPANRTNATSLPAVVDLRSHANCPRVFNQGSLGSCTAQALVCAYHFVDPSLSGSRLFLYYNERVLDGYVTEDVGSTISSGVRALIQRGLCPETLCPYIPSDFAKKPSDAAFAKAMDHQVVIAEQVDSTHHAIRACLAAGFPIALGIEVYSSLLSDAAALTGKVAMPAAGEVSQGGHAVVCVGYTATSWIMRNSWSEFWGDRGYFYLPLAFLVDERLTSDLWRIIAVEKEQEQEQAPLPSPSPSPFPPPPIVPQPLPPVVSVLPPLPVPTCACTIM
jgi:C1A family cysteine protease